MRHKLSGKMLSSRGLDGDIVHITRENTLFRKVVHTGECSQLVVMSVPPGGEVGMEDYPHTDLIFFILKGKAKMIVNSQSRTTRKYEVIFIPAGELHNLTNAGQDDLKLLAIYAPPEYLENSVCRTHEEAQAARREALEHAWEQ